MTPNIYGGSIPLPTTNPDSVGKVVAEMHAINDSPELCALYDRLESLDRQHREELEFQVAVTRELLPYQERAVKAEAALGEALAMIPHNEFSHSFIKDEKQCEQCKKLKRLRALTRTNKEQPLIDQDRGAT